MTNDTKLIASNKIVLANAVELGSRVIVKLTGNALSTNIHNIPVSDCIYDAIVAKLGQHLDSNET